MIDGDPARPNPAYFEHVDRDRTPTGFEDVFRELARGLREGEDRRTAEAVEREGSRLRRLRVGSREVPG